MKINWNKKAFTEEKSSTEHDRRLWHQKADLATNGNVSWRARRTSQTTGRDVMWMRNFKLKLLLKSAGAIKAKTAN